MTRPSDICLSIRGLRGDGGPGSLDTALELIDHLQPTRIEWSYVRDREIIAQFKQRASVFVATINSCKPHGRAVSFEGEPIVSPWKSKFETPDSRRTEICQNNPEDVQARLDQLWELIRDGVTDSFHHDDWYANGQKFSIHNPCFCEHCRRGFREHLGFEFDFDYLTYLRRRGITHTQQLLDLAKAGRAPLWDDYRRFADETVSRYFRKLRANMDRWLGEPATLSVNASVAGFGGSIDAVLPFVSYFNGETYDFSDKALVALAEASRRVARPQVISFFPDVPPERFDSPDFVGRVRRAIALCYCLGLLPLFPYDVWAGPQKPRWFGSWEQYRQPYEHVRAHPEWFDGYAPTDIALDGAEATIRTAASDGPGPELCHTIGVDGDWRTVPVG